MIVQTDGTDHATFPSARSLTRAARTRAPFSTSNPGLCSPPSTPASLLHNAPHAHSPAVVWDTPGRTANLGRRVLTGEWDGNRTTLRHTRNATRNPTQPHCTAHHPTPPFPPSRHTAAWDAGTQEGKGRMQEQECRIPGSRSRMGSGGQEHQGTLGPPWALSLSYPLDLGIPTLRS